MRSCARRGTTPSRTGPTGTACSRTRRLRPSWRAGAASSGSPILDWDVHHGNGTQECFWDRADVLAVSLHMRHGSWGPSHPQTGAPGEVGVGDGAGRNVNVELAVGTGDEGYRRAMARVVEPIVDAFRPRADRDRLRPGCEPVRPQRPHVRARWTASATWAPRPARWPTATATGGWCSSRRAATAAPTPATACTPRSRACSARGPLLADPMAYLPDDADRADAAIAAVRHAMAPYWPL